ncbi:MAG: T9SS type A sorting domain-containing protein [Parafilimonas sp.]
MKKISICLTFIFIISANVLKAQIPQLGKEEIIKDSFYVVHSGEGANATQISNIYLINGKNDTIWIFGSGYGNKYGTAYPTNDIVYYGRPGPYRNAIDDARIVDTIIHSNFGIPKSKAKLIFLTPHGHLDHINMEFLSSLCDTLGYNKNVLKIFVHTNDYQIASCNKPYCGDTLHPHDPTNPFFGAPFDVPWNSTYLQKFQQLGQPSDMCNQTVKSFTSVLGTCYLVKGRPVANGGHTDGTINLDNPTNKFRIEGAGAGKSCPVDHSWTIFHIHGGIPDSFRVKASLPGLISKNDLIKIFPNPAHDQLNLQLSFEAADGNIAVYDAFGIKITSFTILAGTNKKISCAQWPHGLYTIAFSNKNNMMSKKIILIE